MSEGMVASVATALQSAHYEQVGRTAPPLATEKPGDQEMYRAWARKAIVAMREPTDAMFASCDSQLCYGELDIIWKSMIDGALK